MKKRSIEDYQKEVQVFEKITPAEADELLEARTGKIVYIGFDSCPYCRKFVHTLSPLAEEKGLSVYYVDAKDADHSEAIQEFRGKYTVKTVPGLLYSSKMTELIVKTDSSLTASEILTIIEYDE